jgi:hypothetical protein
MFNQVWGRKNEIKKSFNTIEIDRVKCADIHRLLTQPTSQVGPSAEKTPTMVWSASAVDTIPSSTRSDFEALFNDMICLLRGKMDTQDGVISK